MGYTWYCFNEAFNHTETMVSSLCILLCAFDLIYFLNTFPKKPALTYIVSQIVANLQYQHNNTP